MIDADAIPGGPDIDVLKVAHHGSDTSSGQKFIHSTKPEVAIISSDFAKDKLPKKTSLRAILETKAEVLVTGSATGPDGSFNNSKNEFGGPDWNPPPGRINDKQGTITIVVAKDGRHYTVTTEKNWKHSFSAVDGDN